MQYPFLFVCQTILGDHFLDLDMLTLSIFQFKYNFSVETQMIRDNLMKSLKLNLTTIFVVKQISLRNKPFRFGVLMQT